MGGKSDGVNKSTAHNDDEFKRLVIAGVKSFDPLDIVNEFYSVAGWRGPVRDISNPYWQRKVSVLAERVARTEKWLKECRDEIFRLNSPKSYYRSLPDDDHSFDEQWLESIGFESSDFGYELYNDSDKSPLRIKRSASYPNVWSASIDGTPWPFDVWTRGCVRRLLVALQQTQPRNPCEHGEHTWDIIEDVSESTGNVEKSVKCVLCGFEDSFDCIQLDELRDKQRGI